MDFHKPCRVVTGSSVAQGLLSGIVQNVKSAYQPPRLVGFLANTDPDARSYAEWTDRTCVKHGICFELRVVDKENLKASIRAANLDNDVDGIMVYYPVFDVVLDQEIKETVQPSKDVEGLHFTFSSNLYKELPSSYLSQRPILPATPLAMVEILRSIGAYDFSMTTGRQLFGRNVTIINRSEVVGKPLAALMAYEGANVYSIDVTGVQIFRQRSNSLRRMEILDTTLELDDCLRTSDIVISGVPGEKFKVPLESLQDGCICVNFSSEKNFDRNVRTKASLFVPSIGPVTIAVLMRNLLHLIDNKRDLLEHERYLERRSEKSLRPWNIESLAIRSVTSLRSWYRKSWLECTMCIVGVSVGLLSLLR